VAPARSGSGRAESAPVAATAGVNRDRHVEPAGAVAAIGARAIVGGVGITGRMTRASESRPAAPWEWAPASVAPQIAGACHLLGVRVHQLVRGGVIRAQLVDELRPRLPSSAWPASRDRPRSPLSAQAVAAQLRRGIAQGMLIVQQEVERLLRRSQNAPSPSRASARDSSRTRAAPHSPAPPRPKDGRHAAAPARQARRRAL